MRFSRFMELALYHPQFGYYRRELDPFGRDGDFYTAEQLQPVFGRLISAALEKLYSDLGCPEDFTVVELGAGRAEMAAAFSKFRYVPVEFGRAELPQHFTGVVFSNEFFDAQPVDLAVRVNESWLEQRVVVKEDGFGFAEGEPVTEEQAAYIERYVSPEQEVAEIHFRGIEWLKDIAARLERGFVLTIDYGFTRREAIRFPRGSLMSYHRHQASADVLNSPGERDITTHVPFQVLEEEGAQAGLKKVRQESLAQFLLSLGEENFTKAVDGGHELQLKTLLFGMGESFRVLLQQK